MQHNIESMQGFPHFKMGFQKIIPKAGSCTDQQAVTDLKKWEHGRESDICMYVCVCVYIIYAYNYIKDSNPTHLVTSQYRATNRT